MPTNTYTPLANITLGSSAASVTFSSISQAYRDLIVVGSITGTANADLGLVLNSDTAANYSGVRMLGNGSVTNSATANSSNGYAEIGGVTTSLGNFILQIMDYSATDKHKTTLSRNFKGGDYTVAWADRWANTAAVTTVLVKPTSGSFTSGSTFALYGISA